MITVYHVPENDFIYKLKVKEDELCIFYNKNGIQRQRMYQGTLYIQRHALKCRLR